MSLSNSNKRRRVEPASFGKQQCPAPPPPTPPTTITITEEDVLRFQRQTDPSTWTLHRTLEMQRLHGPRVFGRALHFSKRSMLGYFCCKPQDIYRFYYTSGQQCAPFACEYAHSAYDGKLLAVADEDRRVSFIRTDKDNTVVNASYHHTFYTHDNAVLDVKWSHDDALLLTGSADQLVRMWDTETQSCVATLKGHRSSLRSVNFHPNNPALLVSASKDGSFQIWDMRFRQLQPEDDDANSLGRGAPIYGPIKIVNDAHDDRKSARMKTRSLFHPERSVTCAMFVPNTEDKVISTGSYDGTIKIWDCRAGRDARPIEISGYDGPSTRPRGIADMKLDRSGTRLFSLCLDQSVYMYHLSNISRPTRRYTDPDYTANTFFVKLDLSPDDQFILSGSSRGPVFVWEIERPNDGAVQFKGHKREATSISWCKKDITQFASCSDDGSVRIWNIDKNKKQLDGDSEL